MAQKYFFKLYLDIFSNRDNKTHNIFYGDFKNLDLAQAKAKKYLDKPEVLNINILSERTGQIVTVKGNSIFPN